MSVAKGGLFATSAMVLVWGGEWRLSELARLHRASYKPTFSDRLSNGQTPEGELMRKLFLGIAAMTL
jgi:hypothetical protein